MTADPQRCDCVPAASGYDCVCPCGAKIHAHVPYVFHACSPVQAMSVRPGAGTELKALLKKLGIVAKPNCSCNKRARVMDEKGCDWCEENIDTIDGWLADEARKRKLPYLSLAGRMLIRLAIRRARKKDNG